MAEKEVDITAGPVNTFNDLMKQLQQEIADVKSGKITESTARVVLGIRKEQIRITQLGLQYMRLIKPRGGVPPRDQIPVLPGTDVKDPEKT